MITYFDRWIEREQDRQMDAYLDEPERCPCGEPVHKRMLCADCYAVAAADEAERNRERREDR